MIGLISSPTNLGLRPPVPGSTPGTSKAPEALREAGLNRRLVDAGAVELGTVLAGRYVADPDLPAGRLRNQEAILDHSQRLAIRIEQAVAAGHSPLVIGGDCSLLIATGLALSRRDRHGLVHIDGHTDFRHPGNSTSCASLAGEDLAAAVGMHWPSVADIDGMAPYIAPQDVVHIGCRDDDEQLDEVRDVVASVITAAELHDLGPRVAAQRALDVVSRPGVTGYWLHIDVDVLDPNFMPAVDSPSTGGMSPDELTTLLATLAPGALGAEVACFDPDVDPDGEYARLLSDILVSGLGDLGSGSTAAHA